MAGPGPLPQNRKVALLIEVAGRKSKQTMQEFNSELAKLKKKYGVKIQYRVKGFK